MESKISTWDDSFNTATLGCGSSLYTASIPFEGHGACAGLCNLRSSESERCGYPQKSDPLTHDVSFHCSCTLCVQQAVGHRRIAANLPLNILCELRREVAAVIGSERVDGSIHSHYATRSPRRRPHEFDQACPHLNPLPDPLPHRPHRVRPAGSKAL